MDLSGAVSDQLGVSAGFAYLDGELTENFCGYVNPQTGKPETRNPCPLFDEDGNPTGETQDPEAPKGTELPVTPELKANVTARYEFNVASYDSFLQGSVIYSDERQSDLRLLERSIIGVLPSYTVTDLSAGFGKDSWAVELYIANAFDERAEVARFAQCAETVCGEQTYILPQQPRTRTACS